MATVSSDEADGVVRALKSSGYTSAAIIGRVLSTSTKKQLATNQDADVRKNDVIDNRVCTLLI